MLPKCAPFMVMILFSTLFFSAYAFMPDRIGNGGGVWVCQDSNNTIYDIMFMDVFEGRREYQLVLPETTGTPLDLVQEKMTWISNNLNFGHELNKHLEYVEKNITWIEDVINLIPDGANKLTPHPSTCKQGDWVAVQLVNFTDDFRVLVRRELFDSNLMTDMERAAVYLHEGVYSYLRDKYGDTTSVRARAIVAYLLATKRKVNNVEVDLTDAEKVAEIEKIISQTGPNPTPTPTPANSWICGIKPERDSALYIAEDTDRTRATDAVVKACTEGENHLPGFPGFPGGPGFPGAPDMPPGEGVPPMFPNFGPPNGCKATKVLCEAVTSSANTKTCTLTTRSFSGDKFVGVGRTQLEAQKEAMNKCLVSGNIEFYCYSPEKLECN